MFTDKIERQDISYERIDAGVRRAHRARSAAFVGFIKKAFNRDHDVLKSIDAAL